MRNYCSVPYVYTLEITSACNARCVGCGNVFARSSAYIAPENAHTIFTRISPHAEMIRLTGGEPTLSPVFAEIIKIFNQLQKPLVVFTNGYWQNPEKVLETLSACNNLDGILISLHGYNASSYKAFVRGDHFQTVVNNICRATEAGISVNTNTILTQENIAHMEEVVDLALESGAKVVAFSRYYGVPIPGLTDLTPEQYQYAVNRVVSLRDAGQPVKFNNNIPLCLGGTLTQACPAGDTHCTISPKGKVRVCNHSPYEVGDILSTPITEIWQSQRVHNWRTQSPAVCRDCAVFDLCRGGCQAHANANGLTQDPLIRTPLNIFPSFSDFKHHSLHRDAYPQIHFSMREEQFGYVLINRSQIFKVSHAAKPLLDVLVNSDLSLAQIHEQYGQPALNFIGILYDRRMLELVSERVVA